MALVDSKEYSVISPLNYSTTPSKKLQIKPIMPASCIYWSSLGSDLSGEQRRIMWNKICQIPEMKEIFVEAQRKDMIRHAKEIESLKSEHKRKTIHLQSIGNMYHKYGDFVIKLGDTKGYFSKTLLARKFTFFNTAFDTDTFPDNEMILPERFEACGELIFNILYTLTGSDGTYIRCCSGLEAEFLEFIMCDKKIADILVDDGMTYMLELITNTITHKGKLLDWKSLSNDLKSYIDLCIFSDKEIIDLELVSNITSNATGITLLASLLLIPKYTQILTLSIQQPRKIF